MRTCSQVLSLNRRRRWNEPCLPLPRTSTHWLVLISHPTEDRRLSWPAILFPEFIFYVSSKMKRHYVLTEETVATHLSSDV